ncbi:MAG: response regulator [Defluviitaleaceae bacterium]|nr:response regulator [Defluviitaleaceae bacterium]
MQRQLNKITLTTRFYIAFYIIIALFVVVMVYSNSIVNRVNVTHQYMADFVVTRHSEVDMFEAVFEQFSRIVRLFVLYHEFDIEMHDDILAHNAQAITEFVREMQIITLNYIELVNASDYITERNRLTGVGIMSSVQMNVQHLYRAVNDAFFNGDTANGPDLTAIAVHTRMVEENISRLRPYLYAEAEYMEIEISGILQNHTFRLSLIIVAIVLLSSFLAWHTIHAFTLRIKSIERNVLRIKQGDISLVEGGENEISRLVNDAISSMIDVINRINQVVAENEKGNMDARIDIAGFEGGYREVLLKVNSLIGIIENNHLANLRTVLAEESSLAKSRFLARMSHEIRTPITAVMGISEIQLRDRNISVPVMEAFAKIYDSSKNLLRIINDILDISKIEADKMDLIIDRYKTEGLIADATQLYIAHVTSKNVNFIIDIDENMPMYLIGDDLRIKQIIGNLLSNAFKYTDKGSVKLGMSCEHAEGDNVSLVIDVEDTGRGMSESQILMLTDEYTRFHEKEDRFTAGTGLGMAIMQGLLNMMDGSFKIQSTLNIGTAFRVSIPQVVFGKEVLGKETVEKLARYEIGSLSENRNEGLKYESMPHGSVLVVDDLDANLYVARELMSFYDLKIETETNGSAAIEKIKAGKAYDIIFMDHMMPEMDGEEAVSIIRGLGYKGCIFAFTANAMIGQAEKFLQNGFDGFLSKPIQAVQLDTVLKKYISPQAVNKYLPKPGMLDVLEKKLLSGYKNFVQELKDTLDKNDYKHASYLTHSIKNIVLLMGYEETGRLAAQLEKLFDQNKTSEEALQQLFKKIEALFGELEAKWS